METKQQLLDDEHFKKKKKKKKLDQSISLKLCLEPIDNMK